MNNPTNTGETMNRTEKTAGLDSLTAALDSLANLAARAKIHQGEALRARSDAAAFERFEDARRALNAAADAHRGPMESAGAVISRAEARAYRLGYLRADWL